MPLKFQNHSVTGFHRAYSPVMYYAMGTSKHWITRKVCNDKMPRVEIPQIKRFFFVFYLGFISCKFILKFEHNKPVWITCNKVQRVSNEISVLRLMKNDSEVHKNSELVSKIFCSTRSKIYFPKIHFPVRAFVLCSKMLRFLQPSPHEVGKHKRLFTSTIISKSRW